MKPSPMPVFGIGPLCVAGVLATSAGALALDHWGLLPVCRVSFLALPAKIAAAVLLVLAPILWYGGAIRAKLAENIQNNRLITTGAYAWVRNPVYTAFLFLAWAFLLWPGNLVLLLAMPLHLVWMRCILRRTEEKWLTERYGDAYRAYCQTVNRCIPWFPKK